MKFFLSLVLSITLLLNVQPAKADIFYTARTALQVLLGQVHLTSDERIFISNMKINYDLLKDFEAEVDEETADYYPIVLTLLEIKEMSKEIIELSDTLSNPLSPNYNQALKALREKYDRAEELWEELKKWNANASLSYFKSFIQNFGVKTAWAAGDKSNANPAEVRKTLLEVRKRLSTKCGEIGMVWVGDLLCGYCCKKGDEDCIAKHDEQMSGEAFSKCEKCCKKDDKSCQCQATCGTLAKNDVCCSRTENDPDGKVCLCKNDPATADDIYCPCKGITQGTDEYEECTCKYKIKGNDSILVKIKNREDGSDSQFCCSNGLNGEGYCKCLQEGKDTPRTGDQCYCIGVRKDNWIPDTKVPYLGTCCKKDDEKCKCNARKSEGKEWKNEKCVCSDGYDAAPDGHCCLKKDGKEDMKCLCDHKGDDEEFKARCECEDRKSEGKEWKKGKLEGKTWKKGECVCSANYDTAPDGHCCLRKDEKEDMKCLCDHKGTDATLNVQCQCYKIDDELERAKCECNQAKSRGALWVKSKNEYKNGQVYEYCCYPKPESEDNELCECLYRAGEQDKPKTHSQCYCEINEGVWVKKIETEGRRKGEIVEDCCQLMHFELDPSEAGLPPPLIALRKREVEYSNKACLCLQDAGDNPKTYDQCHCEVKGYRWIPEKTAYTGHCCKVDEVWDTEQNECMCPIGSVWCDEGESRKCYNPARSQREAQTTYYGEISGIYPS